TSEYYDNSTNYGLFVNDNDDQEIFHEAIKSASENFIENHIDSQKDYDKSEVDYNDSEEKEHLENQNKDLQDKYDVLINQVNTFEEQNNEFNEQIKVLNEKNVLKIHVILKKPKDLRPSLYDEKVISLGYTLMFLIHSDEALEIEKFKRARENKIEFAYDYGNLNASYVIEKINFSDDYFQEIINLDFEKIDSLFQQTSSLKPYVPTVILKKIIIDLEEEVKKESSNTSNVDLSSVSHLKLNKDVKRYSRKGLLSCNNSHLGETSCFYVCNDAMNVSCNSRLYDSFDENNLFIFDDESVRISPVSKMPFRKKPCDSVNVRSKSNLNKSLPRTVHRWLPKMQPLAEPIAKWIPKVKRQIDKISKTPNSSGPIFKWVPKVCLMSLVFYLLQIVQICLWIIDSGCSKHMTDNHALLTNFVEKFLGTVRFGNNDFAVIAGYGDVVIGSMRINKFYYVEGLGHNLFSIGQFCDKGLEVTFRKSTCFVQNENGVDLLTGDRS
nr:integrase, catalytic region, zinc finger, CCHC-type, peptidase aspartic, catalytic [Tanacetum cinerariifolium]